MSSLKQFYQLRLHSKEKNNPWPLQKDPPLDHKHDSK